MKITWQLIPLVFWFPAWAMGQQAAFPDTFTHLLEQAGLEVFEPVDAGYRAFKPLENEYLNCQYAIRSNREGLQIRYFVVPWVEGDHATTTPHVAAFRALTSIASNEDEAIISAMQPEDEVLLHDFNADWGMVYFFHPKPGFSQSATCKMLALSKIGQGTVFIFFCFDNPGNLSLDNREVVVRFK